MTTLIITKCGSPITYKLFKDGMDVKTYIKHIPSRRKLKGLVKKVESFNNEDADLYIFTDPGLGALADKMKSTGKNVWGASLLCDKLALDDKFAQKKLTECGFKIGGSGRKLTIGIFYDNGRSTDIPCAFITSHSSYPCGFGEELEGLTTFGFRIDKDHPLVKETRKFDAYVDKHRYTGVIYYHFYEDGGLYGLSPYANRDYFLVHVGLNNPFGDAPRVKVVGSLRVFIPPYPFDDERYNDFVYANTKGRPVSGIKGLFPDDLMYEDGWYTSGCSGVIGDIVNSGDDVPSVCNDIGNVFNSVRVYGKAALVDFHDYIIEEFSHVMPGLLGIKTKKIKKDDGLAKAYIAAIKSGDTNRVIAIQRTAKDNGISIELGGL